MKPNWHGILRILEIQHLNSNGEVLWQQKDVYNTLHQDGEEFLLRAAFTGGQNSTVIPEEYYLGLDNRQSIAASNTMDDLIGEPTGYGYERQSVKSSGEFAINFQNDHFVATSPIVAFRATTGNWGPASNVFITDKSDNTGYLIATAVLSSPIFVNSGDAITMRIGMQLRTCSSS